MKITRIYLDTSVIGGCFDPEFAKWSNGLMADISLGIFRPVISQVVADEVLPAPAFVLQKYQELLAFDPEIIAISDEAISLTEEYIRHSILPEKYYNDLLHIALASIVGVDILVSWNFKHIVRFDKIRLFNAVNQEMNYNQIQIYSPREVTFNGNEGD